MIACFNWEHGTVEAGDRVGVVYTVTEIQENGGHIEQ